MNNLDLAIATELTRLNLTKENTTMTINDIMQTINSISYNEQAIASRIASDLYINTDLDLSVQQSLLVASAFTENLESVDDMEHFMILLNSSFQSLDLTIMQNGKPVAHADVLDRDADFMSALVIAELITESGELGDKLGEILSLQKTSYAPVAPGSIDRRKNYSPVKQSAYFEKAVHVLESTEFTVDTMMMDIAHQVIGKAKHISSVELNMLVNDDAYVLDGCAKLGDRVSVSEFHGDRRGRLYQAACHGPNGQSSDRSRALMNLAGVHYTEAQIPEIKEAIKAEMLDMIAIKDTADNNKQIVGLIKAAAANPVDFIIAVMQSDIAGEKAEVKKPWSFVKAAMIWVDLARGNMPYIGMAVGLDAKCSGPQLAALMVADTNMAVATGFNLTGEKNNKDAYELAIVELDKHREFSGLTRADIKTAFMAIFYGQGWGAFTQYNADMNKNLASLLNLSNPGDMICEDIAKKFHKVVCSSFGKKMNTLRDNMKGYMGKVSGKVKHFMPDGFEVAMNYKVKFNALDQAMEYGVEETDAQVGHLKFINVKLNSHVVDSDTFARNGFVNMIQATDAQLARLIIVNLHELGAQHVIAVHDCFRVNVTEMPLLKEAIKLAYTQLFGASRNKITPDLVKGTDILGMYFDGINKCVDQMIIKQQDVDFSQTEESPVVESNKRMVSQFTVGDVQVRKLSKIKGVKFTDIVDQLGVSYYFAK